MTNPLLFYDDLDEITYTPPPQIYGATLSCNAVGVFKELHGIGVFHSTCPSANDAAFCITFFAVFFFYLGIFLNNNSFLHFYIYTRHVRYMLRQLVVYWYCFKL